MRPSSDIRYRRRRSALPLGVLAAMVVVGWTLHQRATSFHDRMTHLLRQQTETSPGFKSLPPEAEQIPAGDTVAGGMEPIILQQLRSSQGLQPFPPSSPPPQPMLHHPPPPPPPQPSARLHGGTWQELDEATGAAGSLRVPHILHQTGPSLASVRPTQLDFYNECNEIYTKDSWVHKFWTDGEMHEFVQARYPDLFPKWNEMQPIIRKVDTVRYMWMHAFGGVYLDMDGECVRAAAHFFDGLPEGSTAWVGGYPEPFFMASTPGNPFWLFFIDRIFSTWRTTHVRSSSGPQGLHKGMTDWANAHGGPDAVRKFSMSSKDECDKIMPPGDVKHGEATWRWILGPQSLTRGTGIQQEHTIGFIPNQILDPTACKGALLHGCQDSHCHVKPEISNSGALFVHHCMETWGGHKAQDVKNPVLHRM